MTLAVCDPREAGLVGRDPRDLVLRTLSHGLQALDLRLARVLAWLRDQPLETLGYPGWQAFCRERVDWGESWVRDMVRLVRSGLSEVVVAACRGELPLAVAVKAPGWCTPETQGAWIALAREGALPPRGRPRGASSTVEVTDEADVLVIWYARRIAGLLTGLDLSDREADERILEWWRAQRHDLVEEALAGAPRPVPSEADPDWAVEDPATALLGPWRTPGTIEEGLATLDQIQAARRERAVEMGQRYEEVVRLGLHRAWGYGSLNAWCTVALGVSPRTLQRYRELGRALRRFPRLSALPLSKADAIGRVAREWDVARWVAVAERTGVRELQRAVKHVEAGADPEVLLGAYEEAMTTATTTVALARVQAPVPPPLTDRVHPDLPAAAWWLVFEVKLPEQRGFGEVKERVDHVCANAECRRRALRNHAHHRVWRSEGGTDDPENGDCVCPSCHLRLIHPRHVAVRREGERIVWTYPGRVVSVFG